MSVNEFQSLVAFMRTNPNLSEEEEEKLNTREKRVAEQILRSFLESSPATGEWCCIDNQGQPIFFQEKDAALRFSSCQQRIECVKYTNPWFCCFVLSVQGSDL
jgi:hypothetical protein